MKFTDFIGKNHPDPDSLLNPKFDEMCKLAEEYAQSLQLRQPDVISRFFLKWLIKKYIKAALF